MKIVVRLKYNIFFIYICVYVCVCASKETWGMGILGIARQIHNRKEGDGQDCKNIS